VHVSHAKGLAPRATVASEIGEEQASEDRPADAGELQFSLTLEIIRLVRSQVRGSIIIFKLPTKVAAIKILMLSATCHGFWSSVYR
jgi:hypothetical protein